MPTILEVLAERNKLFFFTAKAACYGLANWLFIGG
jgi:hypothetical protein